MILSIMLLRPCLEFFWKSDRSRIDLPTRTQRFVVHLSYLRSILSSVLKVALQCSVPPPPQHTNSMLRGSMECAGEHDKQHTSGGCGTYSRGYRKCQRPSWRGVDSMEDAERLLCLVSDRLGLVSWS